jgi:hypothetical protein
MQKAKTKENAIIKEKGKKYYVHDNGGRPFEVIVNRKAKEVTIYKKEPYDISNDSSFEDYENSPYSIFVMKLNPEKIYIGNDKNVGKEGLGNSILLQMPNDKFIAITDNIFEFSLENGDKFVKFFSVVGNSDVPYPVLLGKNYFYSIVDKKRIPKSQFPKQWKMRDYANGHSLYYELNEDKKKLKKYKELEKRFY